MLLTALRSERHTASSGGTATPHEGVDRIPALLRAVLSAQEWGPLISSLTASPKGGLQPVPPGPHSPSVQAVLLAEGLSEGQVGKDVCHIVAGKGQVDLSASLWDVPHHGQDSIGGVSPRPYLWQPQAPRPPCLAVLAPQPTHLAVQPPPTHLWQSGFPHLHPIPGSPRTLSLHTW